MASDRKNKKLFGAYKKSKFREVNVSAVNERMSELSTFIKFEKNVRLKGKYVAEAKDIVYLQSTKRLSDLKSLNKKYSRVVDEDSVVKVTPTSLALKFLLGAVNKEEIASKRPKAKVIPPPGQFAYRILKFLIRKEDFENIFGQAIADMWEEAAEADAAGDTTRRRFIVWRDHLRLAITLALYFKVRIFKQVLDIFKLAS